MAAFSRAIKVMGRRAASYAGAARGMLGARALRRPAAHRFDTSGRMARLERVVSNASMRHLEELEVGLPSAVTESASREKRSEKGSAEDQRGAGTGRRWQCLGGWGRRCSDAGARRA